MKKFLIIIPFAALMFVSVKYSETVNRFYLKHYYKLIYTEDKLVKKGWDLYDNGQYEKLDEFLKPLLGIYVWNNEIKRMAGLNYIKMGDTLKGAELFASSFENGTNDSVDLIKIIRILFKSGNYGEVIYFYDRNIMRSNVNTAFYYGASLYKIGRNKEALKNIMLARENGFIGDEIDYYTGLIYEKEGRLSDAAVMLQSAYRINRYDRNIKQALIRVYRKSGNFESAEQLLRQR